MMSLAELSERGRMAAARDVRLREVLAVDEILQICTPVAMHAQSKSDMSPRQSGALLGRRLMYPTIKLTSVIKCSK